MINEKEFATVLKRLAELEERVYHLEYYHGSNASKSYANLNRLTPLQVVIMQMYQRGHKSVDTGRRLNKSPAVVRTNKQRILNKWCLTEPSCLGGYGAALESDLTDEDYFRAARIPKDWYEKYGDKDISDDPYAHLYQSRIKK